VILRFVTHPLHFTDTLRKELAMRLASFEPLRLPQDDNRAAAVALAIVPDSNGEASVILTRRSKGLRHHGGQFALPGGRVDPGESVRQAGLRELAEEVALKVDPTHILGTLDDFATRSGFLMTPVVVWGDETNLAPGPGEVAEIYHVPLSDLGRPKALIYSRVSPLQGTLPALDLKSVGTYVFCPTAAILHQFSELAVYDRHTPVSDFEQPAFAWR